MHTLTHTPLAPYTSLRLGGNAAQLVSVTTRDEAVSILAEPHDDGLWILGYGSNVLISDEGLPGTTVMWHGGAIINQGNGHLVIDAGVWWDDAVQTAIDHGLWGMELMSEIPSSVGGAIYGNIAAYGQQVSDTLEWVEVYNTHDQRIETLTRDMIEFSYRASSLQDEPWRVVLRACFKLSADPIHEVRYDAALAIAQEMKLDLSTLENRRTVIIETRRRAGSIYHPHDIDPDRTAGSFFKNPFVSIEQATQLASFDETGKTLERILNQSKVHGGTPQRASAAHVLLAAGFHRGQQWGNVRLHPSHVLKLQALEGATAQEVYTVVQLIIRTVNAKLAINLEPEVKFLGTFKDGLLIPEAAIDL